MAIINGDWSSLREDFIVNYQGKRRSGSISYGSKINKRGQISAKLWNDENQNGRRDSGESLIARYRADATYVYYEVNYYFPESGQISIDKKSGKFSLFHEGYQFAKGRVVDTDYFFG